MRAGFRKWIIETNKKEQPKILWEPTKDEANRKGCILTWPETDFADDVERDKDFPSVVKSWEEVERHIRSKYFKPCKESIASGRSAFKKWQKIEREKKENKKPKKLDGLGPDDIDKIKKALRQVWSWSYSRRLVIKRCDLGDHYSRCEKCRKKVPKIHVDHIKPVGTFDERYVQRLFVPSSEMQGLCTLCHKVKTKADVATIRSKRAEDEEMF